MFAFTVISDFRLNCFNNYYYYFRSLKIQNKSSLNYLPYIYFFLAHNMASDEYCGKPYKIIDSNRKHKIGIVATSLTDFMTKGK